MNKPDTRLGPTIRTTQTIAVFKNAFSLSGVDDDLPAGSYLIETEEERIDALSFTVYRRAATTIALPFIGGDNRKRQVVTIDPEELAAAQRRDAELGISPGRRPDP